MSNQDEFDDQNLQDEDDKEIENSQDQFGENNDDQVEGEEKKDEEIEDSVESETIELKKQTETIQMQINAAQLDKPNKCLLLRETKLQFEQAEFNNNNYKKIAEQYKQLIPSQKQEQFQFDKQTVRWRNKQNPTQGIESNAKLVEWDDGSLILYIGDKPFDLLPIKQVKLDNKIFSAHNNKYFLPQFEINEKVMVREHKAKN